MREYTVKEYDMADYDKFKEQLTYKEALENLERIDSGYIPDWNYSGKEDDFDNYTLHASIWKAQEALEKCIELERKAEE